MFDNVHYKLNNLKLQDQEDGNALTPETHEPAHMCKHLKQTKLCVFVIFFFFHNSLLKSCLSISSNIQDIILLLLAGFKVCLNHFTGHSASIPP